MKVIAVVDTTTNKLIPYILDEMGGVIITTAEKYDEDSLIVTLVDLEFVEPLGANYSIHRERIYEQFRK